MVDFDCSAVTTNLGRGKGGFGVVLGKGTDVWIFGGATGHKPDRPRVAEERVGGGDAPDAKFGNEVGCDQELFFFESGGFGEERRGVAVVTDSQKDEIEAGRIAQVVADLLFVGASSDFSSADFAMDAFDMNSCALEGVVYHAVVAVFMIRGDPTFVAEVEAGGRPGPFEAGEALVEGFGSGTAREGNVKGATGLEGRTTKGFPTCNHGVEPRGRFRKFVQKHNKNSAKILLKSDEQFLG